MCKFVTISNDIIEQMKAIYPNGLPDEIFYTFKGLTKDYVLKNINGHKVEKRKIDGIDGEHEVIHATFDDAKKVLNPLKVYAKNYF